MADLLEQFIKQHEALLKWLGLGSPLAMLSGWVVWAIERFKHRRISVFIGNENSSVFLYNDGQLPIEIVTVAISLSDMFSRPEFSKQVSFNGSLGVIVKPDQRAEIFTISPSVIASIEEICKPRVTESKEAMRDLVPGGFDIPRSCLARFYVGIKKAGSQRLISKHFDRTIGGHPSHGYGVGPSIRDQFPSPTLKRRLSFWARRARSIILNPRKEWRERALHRDARLKVAVGQLLQAGQRGVIKPSDLEKRLKHLLTAHRKEPASYVTEFLDELNRDPTMFSRNMLMLASRDKP